MPEPSAMRPPSAVDTRIDQSISAQSPSLGTDDSTITTAAAVVSLTLVIVSGSPPLILTQAIDHRFVAWRTQILAQDKVNRPGKSRDSVPWEGWSHVWEYVEEVPGRAA